MDRILSNKWAIAAFVLPALILFLLIAVVPIFITGYYSFYEYTGFAEKVYIGTDNYERLFTEDSAFRRSLLNTLILILGSVFIQIPIAFLIANKLAKGIPGEKAFRTIYFIPVIIATTIVGKMFYYVFSAESGMINAMVRGVGGWLDGWTANSLGTALGMTGFEYSWLTNNATAFLCVAFVAIWQYLSYHMLILYAGIKSIPSDYYEAAMIDGATGFKATWNITVPLLAPVIKTCVVLAVVGSVKTYDIVVAMVGSGVHSGTQLPVVLLVSNIFKANMFGYGSAQAMFLVVLCLLLSYLIARVFKKSEENAAMN